MACLFRLRRTTLSVVALFGAFLPACSSGSSGGPSTSDAASSSSLDGTSPPVSDGSEGNPADDAADGDVVADATGIVDAGPDVFSSCSTNRPDAGEFPSDVAAVMADKCQTCHQSPPKNHAPFSLLTYADTQAADSLSPYSGLPIWQVMHAVIQPKGIPHMPFGNAPQLTSAEMTTLDGWLLGCALPQADDGGGEPSGDAASGSADGSGSLDAGGSVDATADSAADAGGSSDAGGQ